ncbi:MAG: hypothetical protein JWP47_276 [Polaromonas sp.]|nr:hypothetical protein [Polaromonas sp.]
MIGLTQAFSSNYAKARVKFLEAAALANVNVASHEHPLQGLDGETLAMDVALDSAPDAHSLLIVSSACHGVEGFCGSGVQVFALHDADWRDKARTQGIAVLYVHAVNPYGFSHMRRATHENIDLNRNFQDFSQPLPVNEAYRALHSLLLPERWPPDEANGSAIEQGIASMGMQAYQAAITRGQHEFADGLFYGARRLHGATPSCGKCCARTVAARAGWRGSIFMQGWALMVLVSGSLPAVMTPWRWPARAAGGMAAGLRRSPRYTTVPQAPRC